ncbi:MAG TPA: M13 family metallopeptidase, partial [Steroidobacteraceae bacterium]|nr:M13 family metallopeptidase [Steroidobacteraceae bacterium]
SARTIASIAAAAAAAGLAAGSLSSTAPAAARHAQIGAFGLDLTGGDPSVKPGDDFFTYANGHWYETTQIPPDRSSWGSFIILRERSLEQMRGILEALPRDAPAGTNPQKLRDFYQAYLDTDAIEHTGLAPARPTLDAIAAAATGDDLAKLMGRPELRLRAPIRFDIDPDEKDPEHYMVRIVQSGLGLPDRDYYLKDEAVYKDLRAKYAAHIERLLKLAGDADAASEAKTIVDLETEIAKLHWPRAKIRERDLTYNPYTRESLVGFAPGFPWVELLGGASLGAQPRFIVFEPDAVQGLGALFEKTPLKSWQSYLRYHYLAGNSDVLPKAFDDEVFEFYGRTLHGREQQQARWKRSVDAVDRSLGEAAGALYVKQYFPPSSKQQMLELVENLRGAYHNHIEKLPWMSDETKKVALEKLAAFHPKIGYPDKWRDYSALDVKPGDAFGNVSRGVAFEWQRKVKRLGGPTDRGEWEMTPQTVNAYYNPTFNEVVFPAAILQAPFFDPNADAAVNYGAIGSVIGHEMGHGFDDQGSKSDAHGVLHTWWLPSDTDAFHKRVDRLAEQYDTYTVLPGLNINGRLTLGENIGDLGGVSVSNDAYHRSLHGAKPPLLDGLTGDQRFFLSLAQAFRFKQRPEDLRSQVMSDPHSPSKYRVNGVVRNVDAWYGAFNVQPGEKLYLPEDQRVRIW